MGKHIRLALIDDANTIQTISLAAYRAADEAVTVQIPAARAKLS